jgi:hypothetical protein
MVEKIKLKPESGYYHFIIIKISFISYSFQNITVIQTSIEQLFCTLFCLDVKKIQTTNVWKKGAQKNIQTQKTDCPVQTNLKLATEGFEHFTQYHQTIAPKNLTCIGRDKQDVHEVKNYGGWIMLKKLGITDRKQEPQLGSRLIIMLLL